MQKIISLFQRNYDGDRLVRDEIVPGAEWVVAGAGVATRKLDGISCLVRSGRLYKRYDAKKGKTPPAGFEAAQEAPDAVTGHWPGWLSVGDGPEDQWHREALNAWRFDGWDDHVPPDGTYELIGPKVQGGAEGWVRHALRPHGEDVLSDAPRAFDDLKAYLSNESMEGIVWHHPDGRMVKIKAKDFGIRWPRR